MNKKFIPGYKKLNLSGKLKERADELWRILESCELCPRLCKVNRLSGERGFCLAGREVSVASAHPHFGEEAPLAGSEGSGTIFFSHCGLRCVFCLNWDISHRGEGRVLSIEGLSGMMLRLQEIGCHNINVVTPTHYAPHIIFALDKAADKGLNIPLVYNTHGWERPEILRLLDGVVDIYLADFKYSDSKKSALYSAGAENYPAIIKAALQEMNHQVGAAIPDDNGLIRKGLMIRHLVMPGAAGGSIEVIKWIKKNLPADTYVNIMSQYSPNFQAYQYPEISRRITRSEYEKVVSFAKKEGLTNLEIQGYFG